VHANIFRNKERVVIQDFYMATPKHPFFRWFLDNRKAAFEKDPAHPAKGPFSYSIEKEIDEYKAFKVTERQMKKEARLAALDATNLKSGIVKFRGGGGAAAMGVGVGGSNGTAAFRKARGGSRGGSGGRGGGQKRKNAAKGDGGGDLDEAQDTVDLTEGVIVELREDFLHSLVDSSNSRLGKTCSLSPIPDIAKDSCTYVNKGVYFRPSESSVAVHMWTHVYLGWNLLRGAYNARLYNSVEKALPPTLACGSLISNYL
jgi:hypothetical protein